MSNLESTTQNEEREDLLQSEEDRAYEWILRRQHSGLTRVFNDESMVDPDELFALKAKVFRALSSRGFEFGNIDRAWRRMLAEFKSNA